MEAAQGLLPRTNSGESKKSSDNSAPTFDEVAARHLRLIHAFLGEVNISAATEAAICRQHSSIRAKVCLNVCSI